MFVRLICIVILLLVLPSSLAQNPNRADFPASIVDDTKFPVHRNITGTQAISTTLSSGIDASTLTIPVVSEANFEAGMVVTVNSERMNVCTVTASTLTLCTGGRGFHGTTAVTHLSAAVVSTNTAAVTNLAVAIANGTTLSVSVLDASAFLEKMVITIENERMLICTIAVNTFTICAGGRGYDGSFPGSHPVSSQVRNHIVASDLNQIAAEVKALETELGITGASNFYDLRTDENIGLHFMDIQGIAVPGNPASGTRRLFTNTSTGELSVRTNAGATVSLEGAGGGGSPGGADTEIQYNNSGAFGGLSTLTTDGTNLTLADTAYVDIAQRTAPANPASGTRRLFTNTTTGELSIRTSAGRTLTLESQVFNVRDYGATCDGSTDDRAAFQSAHDACDAAGGGTVYVSHTTTSSTATICSLKSSHPVSTGVHLLWDGDGCELSCASRNVEIRGEVTTIDVIGVQAVTNAAIKDCTINRPTETLSAGINNSQTTITVTGIITAALPATPFDIFLFEDITKEVMTVTAAPSTTWTVTRATRGTANAFTTAATIIVADDTADGIAFANGDSSLFIGQNLLIENHYRGVSALANRPGESKWDASEARFNIFNGMEMIMNNGERMDEMRFAKNGNNGFRAGSSATLACDGDIAISNSLSWQNIGDGWSFEGDPSNLCFNIFIRGSQADANGGRGFYFKHVRSGELTGTASFNGLAGAEFDTGTEGIVVPGLLSRRNAGDCVLINDNATQITFGTLNCASNTLAGLRIEDNANNITVGTLISGDDASVVAQDSGIHIDGTSGTPDKIVIDSARFPGMTNRIVITGTVGEEIQINQQDGDYALTSFDSMSVLLDADADSSGTAVFDVRVNNQTLGSATSIFDINEGGDVRVFNQGSASSRLVVQAGGTQGTTALASFLNNGGALLSSIDFDARLRLRQVIFANLGAVTNGTDLYCTDCTKNSDPCTSGGSGAKVSGINGAWVCGVSGGGSSHAILSATHTDTLAAAVIRGDVMIGNATPAWSRLAVGGAGTYLRSDATDPAWSTLDATDLTTGTVPVARVGADHLDAIAEIAAGIKRGPDATDTHLLTTDVAAPAGLRCLQMDTDGSVVLDTDTCSNLGPGGTTTIDALGDAAGIGVVAVADFSQTWDWNSPATSVAKDALTLTYTLDASTDATTQRVLRVVRPEAANTGVLEAMLSIENLDTAAAVTAAIEIRSAAGGITRALDLNDAQITTLIEFTTGSISPSDLELIDDGTITLTTETTGNYADGDGEAGAALTGDNAGSFFLAGELEVARGGSGVDTITGLIQGNGASDFTAITNSSTVGEVLRVTGASAYAWGALDLADADAVTGVLDEANLDANVVLDNAANTYGAFAQSFAAASMTLPVSAGAAPTANGAIAYDSTASQLEYGDNTVNRVVVNLDEAQSLLAKTLVTPTIVATGWTNANHAHTAANSGGVLTVPALPTVIRDRKASWNVEDPVTGDDGDFQTEWAAACTLQEVACNVQAATSVTIDLYERARATPESGTTGMLTTPLVCDTNGAVTTSFTDAALAANVPLALGITAVSGTPGLVRVHVTCRLD